MMPRSSMNSSALAGEIGAGIHTSSMFDFKDRVYVPH
jgi:hypothetical protein